MNSSAIELLKVKSILVIQIIIIISLMPACIPLIGMSGDVLVGMERAKRNQVSTISSKVTDVIEITDHTIDYINIASEWGKNNEYKVKEVKDGIQLIRNTKEGGDCIDVRKASNKLKINIVYVTTTKESKTICDDKVVNIYNKFKGEYLGDINKAQKST